MQLRVLFVEDSEDDVALILRELKRIGYEVEARRVETSDAMRAALADKDWDLIICDYSLPSFNAPQALEVLKATGKDLPFIILSGTIGEETAVAVMKAGAHDFMLKDNLTRLGPVIERELGEAEIRRERRQAEKSLRESEAKYRNLLQHSIEAIYLFNPETHQITECNSAFLRLTGYTADDVKDLKPYDFITHDRDSVNDFFAKALKSGGVAIGDRVWKRKDGTQLYVDINASKIQHGGKDIIFVVARDVTERKRAEEELANREKRFRALIENGVDFISLLAVDGTLLWESPSATNMLGYAENAFVNRNILEIVHPDDLGWVQERFAKLAAAPGAQDRDSFRLKHRDGSWRWVDAVVTNLLNEPSVQAIVINYHDVTDRRKAELELRESEEHLKNVYNLSVDAMITTDSDHNISLFNVAAERMFGWPADEIIGKPLEHLIPQRFRAMHQKYVNDFNQVPDNQVSGVMRNPVVGVRANGEEFPCEVSLSTIETSRGITNLAIVRDITERKQAQDLLQQSEKRYRSLVNQIPAVVYTDDPSGRIQFVGPQIETLLGFKPQEWIAGGVDLWSGQIHTEDRERVVAKYRRLLRSGEPFEIEYRLHAKDGRLVWVQDKANVIRNEAGSLISVQGIIYDITERKQTENAIRQNLAELEMLYQSGLLLNQLLNPKEIAQKIISVIGTKLDWHHTAIRLYHPENEMLELLAFNLPRNMGERERHEIEGRLKSMIVKAGNGLTGWAAQHRRIVRVGDVSSDPRYLEIFPGLKSGLYVPLQAGDRLVGIISIESETSDAFSEADERLTATLANQAAIALENARLHEETVRQINQLQALHAIDLTISSSFNQSFTLDVLLNHAMNQLGADAASILLMQPHQQNLKVAAEKGFRGRGLEQTELRLTNSFAGRVIMERRMIHADTSELGTVQPAMAKVWSEEGFKSQHLVPLISKGEVKGVLSMFFRKDFVPDPFWNNFFETLAGQAAIAVDSTQMFEGLQRANMELAVAYDATIEGWSQAMDLRDKETEGHTQRVTKMAVELAKAMKFDDEELVHIRRGALLHDIGKIGVPDHILLKPDKLTDEEWKVMRMHPQFAYDMLNSVAYLRRALDIPYCHHEKWDGTGYPRGLKGEQIPLSARIFAVIDVWDAVTSDRPYRKAWSKEEALLYVREQSGKHFDPQVAEVFLREFGNA